MKKTVLLLGGMLKEETEQLQEHFNVIRLKRKDDPLRVLETYRNDIVAVISTPGQTISRNFIDALPNLEIICQFAIGVDNIDLEYAKSRGIAVTNTPDLVTEDTADIGLALMLAIMRRVVEADMYVRVGKWPNAPMGPGVSLSGKTLGVLGLGRIGRAVAKRGEACGMNIAYHSRSRKDEVDYVYYGSVTALAAAADVLIVCCAGGDETRGLVDYKVFEALGPGGFIVNIARGSVVNEEDLLVALNNKEIAGAGLDVFDNEPHVPEGLFSMDNVVLLPHIGSATRETRSKMGRLVIENLLARFDGKALITPVDIK